MLEQFKLPRYIDGLSFADASKKIQSKFKERTDPESINTEKEMLDRLKQMQEHVKAQKEAQEQPERSGGDLVAGSEGMPLDENEITQEYNQEQSSEEDLMSQIQNAYGGNQYAYGGPGEETPVPKSNIKGKVVGLTGISDLPTNDNMDFDTKQIVRYQPGVTSGETGKSGFYLYSKNAGEAGFDPLRHREFVNQEEMMAVQRTPQWKAYMQGQSKMALGGDEDDMHFMPETAEQRFSPIIQANNQPISSSIMSLANTASNFKATGEEESNKFDLGGDQNQYYKNNNPYFTLNPGQVNPMQSPSMGPINSTESSISAETGTQEGSSGPGVMGYAKMGATALELGKEAFGPTGVDTSGRVKVEGKKVGNAAFAGATKGASAGMALGPWGAAAGAVIGGAAGIIGAKKQQKDANIANRNATYADAAVNDNQFNMGGNLNKFHEGGPQGHKHNSKTKTVKAVVKTSGYGADGKFIKPSVSKEMDADLMSLIKKETDATDATGVTGVQESLDKYYDDWKSKQPKSVANKIKDAVLDNKDSLRYAPVIGNIMQLANLKKPEQETTPELSTRYKKNVVDEQGLINLVREETAGNREAILSSSEGSGNAARANLLGTQLNATKALSDAFMKSQEANARENAQEQSFNLGVDTTNLQQQTLAQDIRARNKGAYDTEKSRLKTAVAADLGAVGQEELYKKFPELMGADYDWKGKYKKLKDQVDSTKKA